MAKDSYPGTDEILSAPASRFEEVTPDDSNDLDEVPKYLYIGATAGDVVLVDKDGNEATFRGEAGQQILVRPRRVKATGTTASPIIACY